VHPIRPGISISEGPALAYEDSGFGIRNGCFQPHTPCCLKFDASGTFSDFVEWRIVDPGEIRFEEKGFFQRSHRRFHTVDGAQLLTRLLFIRATKTCPKLKLSVFVYDRQNPDVARYWPFVTSVQTVPQFLRGRPVLRLV
jgi:hypothetical protein